MTSGFAVAKNLQISRCLFVEHYPEGLHWKDEESFDLVTFERRGQRFYYPVWTHVSREWVEGLIKEEFVP